MLLRAALALLTLLLAAPAALADVPLSRAASGQLTAPVRIGGGAATQFVIDTGAEGCTVSGRFAAQRHLLAVGVDGARVLAPSVEIDGQRIGALQCAVMGDAAIDGVIGADALGRFVVNFDTRAMRLSLHGGAQHGQALVSPRARLVDVERLPNGALAAPVRLNNARGLGIIDTGARRSVFNDRFAAAAGVKAGSTAAFDLAGTVTPGVDGRVADLPAFADKGLRDAPAMILGLDRLQGLRLVIDYPRGRVWFDPG